LRVSEIRTAKLVADSVVTEQLGDSILRVFLARKDLYIRYSPRNITVNSERIENPFQRVNADTQFMVPISIDLELEESSYGKLIAPRHDIAMFWLFGVLSLIQPERDLVMGSVRWRAHLKWPGQTEQIAAAGHGLCGGRPEALGRREAILSANRRALYDVAVAIVDELDRSLSLKVKRRSAGMKPNAYRQMVDGE